jgi:aqualysin 1
VLRPALASALALSLIAGLVTVVTIGVPELGGSDEETFELAMAPGFEPSPVPTERDEDHVILTVDADGADGLTAELTELLGVDPIVLSVRTDRTSFTVPRSVAEQLDAATVDDVEVVADTPLTTLSDLDVRSQSPVPSWGLDRIDAVDDERFDERYRYVSSGAGVTVYVIDTGVRSDHSDLSGRVVEGWSAVDDGRGTQDCNGHGTHVAGTIAGTSFGVAKDARIVAVRVLDCTGAGFASSLVSGINWVVANHPGGPAVINLSVGGPANSAVDRAVADAAARGILVVAAAGNDGGDACAVSPARAGAAVTTGATTSSDARASYSNTGSCVDMFAPGSGITSAWPTSATASATLSGTSMAAPHVAGLAARLYQANPGAGPSRIRDLLTGSASTGSVEGADGGSNLLVNLVDFEELDCEALVEEGGELPEECLEEFCEALVEEGAELPEECLEEDRDALDEFCDALEEAGEELPQECLDRDGRPEEFPGLGRGLNGLLPPGFGGTPPGISRAPGLVDRRSPGLGEGAVPPGLAGRDVLPPGRADRGRPETGGSGDEGDEEEEGTDGALPRPPAPGRPDDVGRPDGVGRPSAPAPSSDATTGSSGSSANNGSRSSAGSAPPSGSSNGRRAATAGPPSGSSSPGNAGGRPPMLPRR